MHEPEAAHRRVTVSSVNFPLRGICAGASLVVQVVKLDDCDAACIRDAAHDCGVSAGRERRDDDRVALVSRLEVRRDFLLLILAPGDAASERAGVSQKRPTIGASSQSVNAAKRMGRAGASCPLRGR